MTLPVSDAALILGATMRLSRLVVADDLGQWFVKVPARMWAEPEGTPEHYLQVGHGPLSMSRSNLVSGLDCPFCIGFWLGAVVSGSYVLTRALSPNIGLRLWRFGAGVLALNEVAGHLAARLGDTAE